MSLRSSHKSYFRFLSCAGSLIVFLFLQEMYDVYTLYVLEAHRRHVLFKKKTMRCVNLTHYENMSI